jgi:Rrf2 family transcriptional regulator, cysteine metabolism repressor
MKISTKVRYGMRAMIELTRRNDEAPVMLGIIAKNQDLSEKYLEQLFTLLRNAGLVKSERGAKGGYRLAKEASKITIYDIFVAMNGPLVLAECVSGGECEKNGSCETKKIWIDLTNLIENYLSDQTLAELAESSLIKGGNYVI